MPGQTYAYVTDPEYVERAVRACTRYVFRRRATLVQIAAWLVIFLGVFSTFRSPGALAFAVVVWAAMVGLMWLTFRRKQRRLTTGSVPAGSLFEARLDEEGLWLAYPLRWGHISYRAIGRVVVDGPCVLLVLRFGGGAATVLPREICPDEMVAELRARVQRAAPGALMTASR